MISVIVPNYNHAKYLRQRIDSILQQTYQDFEIIILDDFSTDNSKEIIESYRKNVKITHIIYNEQNSGSTFKQWEKGFKLAKGEYIWIAESDDYADCRFLEIQMRALGLYPSAVLAMAGSFFVDKDSRQLKSDPDRWWATKTKKEVSLFNGRKLLNDAMLTGNKIYNASTIIIKRSAISKIENNYTNYKFIGDLLFWTECLMQGDLVYSKTKLNYFRQHDNKVTPRAKKEGISHIEFYNFFHYVKSKYSISQNKIREIVGYAILNLQKNKFIEEEYIRKDIFKKWKSDFPKYRLYYYIYFMKFTRKKALMIIKQKYRNLIYSK